MIGRPKGRSFRLIDGVVVAAVALLGLKVLGLATGGVSGPPEPAELPTFGRVIAHARSNYDRPDPSTTGSVAENPAKPKPADGPAAPPEASNRGAGGPKPSLFPSSTSEQAILERLSSRRDELQQRVREIEAREKLIQDQERKLDDRLGQTRSADEAGKEVAVKAAAEDPNLKNLVVMYETMKPKEAARVFERLPLEILTAVVTRMNSRKMAEVLASMSPESAEKLTVALTKRTGAPDRSPSALPPGELPAIELPSARR